MGKKSILNQRYCYKITSSFLKRNGYDLKLDDIKKGMKDRNIVGIGDSEAYRAIRRITHSPYDEDYINHIKEDIAVIEKKNKIGKVDHRKLLQLREEKRIASLEPSICNVICESDKQYDYLSKNGFKINGKQYTLLLGTTGGIKNNTVMFCTKEIYDKLYEFILNGADMRVPMIPSKLMAYMALTFSSSTPVTNTDKILVVKDVETQFKAPVTYIKWDDDEEEPSVEQLDNYDVVLNACDGCGMITPELAYQWSKDLQLDYDCPAFCVRNSWVKGMLTAFDFKKYCKEVIGKEEVVDVWGKTHNINDIDIIMNESMLKFWKAYKSIDEYVYSCNKNGYTFSVTKYVHDDIDKKRRLNYQYLQCLDLSDDDIHNLLNDDIQEIKDVLGLDYRKTILFGKGENLTDKNVWNTGTRNDNHIKALMVDGRTINDDYVNNKVRRNIAKRIKQLKTGKIAVEGNYQIIIGEPIIQLEHMFGLEPKGLLKENEYYIEYWRKQGINKVGGFRSPMSCRSNARVANISYNEEAVKWYGHLEGLIIFNAWDTSMMAYNGAD